MDFVTLEYPKQGIKKEITVSLPASKSESNRILILNTLFPNEVHYENLSNAQDTVQLKKLLDNKSNIYDAGATGTVFRFLAAYLTLLPGEKILTGSARMKQRPIKGLVEALNTLGAKISYVENEDYPPILIKAAKPKQKSVVVDNSQSSQFVTALMLIAPALPNGLGIEIKDRTTSFSYIRLTAAILNYFGISTEINERKIQILPSIAQKKIYFIENDWSSASYWYSFVAFSQNITITLPGLKKQSFQGDAVLRKLFSFLGVRSKFTDTGLIITKTDDFLLKTEVFEYDFSDCPDIAPTLAVTIAGLKIKGHLTGLQTLNIKESKRIDVLAKELEKFNVRCTTQKDALIIDAVNFTSANVVVNTYNDHRIAMAFAPLVLLTKKLMIEKPNVVEKSYPNFWEDMKLSGIGLKK